MRRNLISKSGWSYKRTQKQTKPSRSPATAVDAERQLLWLLFIKSAHSQHLLKNSDYNVRDLLPSLPISEYLSSLQCSKTSGFPNTADLHETKSAVYDCHAGCFQPNEAAVVCRRNLVTAVDTDPAFGCRISLSFGSA